MIVKTYIIEGPNLFEVIKGIESEIDTKVVAGGRRENVIPLYEEGDDELYGRELDENEWIQIIRPPSLNYEIYRWMLQMPVYSVEELSQMAMNFNNRR